ncbi:MAG: hypothetical protein A2Y15_09365 [Clostridiales bacterium GWF2_36_10]|nr:MAG: hypothetical protein A2Y15_09365 [Clostridiales bacterium GWF2_36_10]HAN21413.1 hypothetical protein [Clostridiales bacterium]
MKTLIAYASKTGTTEKCAKLLSEQFNGADLFDLQSGNPDLNNYDVVVIGGSIRAGMLHKTAKKYVKANIELLKTKKIAFFVCSADVTRANDFLKANIPADLLARSFYGDSFGGEIDLTKQKGLFKFIVKKMTEAGAKKGTPLPNILPENIKKFADKINSLS